MQSCWLPPSQRPSVAEVFLLLSSLLAAERGMARGSVGEEDEEDEEYNEGSRGRRGESDESFERRWDSLRPPAFQTTTSERQRDREYSRERDRDNSYPLLDPVGNCITPSSSELDDILTVTETSKGLNFEYFWEKAHARRGYKPLPPPQSIPTLNHTHRQSLDTPTVVPVISARSPSLASEYYIRLEEHTPQDKSPTLKGKPQATFGSDAVCPGDMELVEIRSGMLGKERVPYSSDGRTIGRSIQTVRSTEVQLHVPNTGVAEFRDTSCRMTDFSVVDLGDDEEEDKKRGGEGNKYLSNSSQAPVLPPKPRSMSMSSAGHLHSRPLPAPPLGYHRGLPHYTLSGRVETDPHHIGSCPPSTFDHLGLHRSRQALPPSPSLSPSLPPSSHPIYPTPPMCPPPLPPHSKPMRGYPSYNMADTYSRYSRTHIHTQRDPLSCEDPDREEGMRRASSLHNSKEHSHSRKKDFDSPVRRVNPLRPVYRNLPRTQIMNPQGEGHSSSSSPTYSDEDDSPFMSPVKMSGGTTITHSSLSEDADPATAELFSRGMRRTQSRLATILPTIWKEDAELQAESVAAARKSPMHLFLTEISSLTESGESKPETGKASWEEEKQEKKGEERWGNYIFPNRGMRRSQSLVTELGSAERSWGNDRHNDRTGPEGKCKVTEESFQRELFLTEIDTQNLDPDMEGELEQDPVKYLHPAGSRLRPYVCAPGLPSYSEAEEAYSKGIRRSRSLLAEMTTGGQQSELQEHENEPQRIEMTREEFLKEIQSAETFLTEIISRQKVTTEKKDEEVAYSPTPMSPEYESICIDPDSSQTIRFQSESSVRASNKGKDETQMEAIYAQVTKRAKKSEIKVTMRPEIPILHIGPNKQPVTQTDPETHESETGRATVDAMSHTEYLCQHGGLLFSEKTPKNGMLFSQPCNKEGNECSDTPALPARGEQRAGEMSSPSHNEPTGLQCENKTHFLHETDNQGETTGFIKNGDILKDDPPTSTAVIKNNSLHKNDSDVVICQTDEGPATQSNLAGSKSLAPGNNLESYLKTKQHEESSCPAEHCLSSQAAVTPAATPTTPDWDQSLDISLMTPTDSVLSPMTSSSADCLTPSDSWLGGGGGGSGGWRALGSETPHRDSAYFSDSDWEGEGLSRRVAEGLGPSRPGSGRGGDRGTLTGIEEKTEVEEEGETGEKSPFKQSVAVSARTSQVEDWDTILMTESERIRYQNAPENDVSYIEHEEDIQNSRLEFAQRDDSGIFQNECQETNMKGLSILTMQSNDSQSKGSVEFIAKMFSNLEDETGLSYGDTAQVDKHYTDGIISHMQITDCKHQDSTNEDLHLKNITETNSFNESGSGSQSRDSMSASDNKDCARITHTNIDSSALNAPCSGNSSVESMMASNFDQHESRLSRFYGIQTSNTPLGDDTSTPLDASNRKCGDDTISPRGGTFWPEGGDEEAEDHEESPGLELQNTDANELGLRNLCYSANGEGSMDGAKTETENQLAAGELSNAKREKSPQRVEVSQDQKAVVAVKDLTKESPEGLEQKRKELWNTLDEEEGRACRAVITGELDCHRFTQSDLHLWPAENDQWASPENRRQDVELRSELFSGFGGKAWEVGERLVVGREFWETEENDELAGSEPHPAALEGIEETCNDERQGLTSNLELHDSIVSDCHQADQVLDIQQDENIESLEEIDDSSIDMITVVEVENLEIPEQEILEDAQNQTTPALDTVKNSEEQLAFAEEENQNFNRWPSNQLYDPDKEQSHYVIEIDACSNSENHSTDNVSSNISICVTEAPPVVISRLENVDPAIDTKRPPLADYDIEKKIIINLDGVEDSNGVSFEPESIPTTNDIVLPVQGVIEPPYSQVDNFSSLDFPSPPPSIDLDVQDDKFESLDDSFPSPPPSVIEGEELISHMNLEDFIASTESKKCNDISCIADDSSIESLLDTTASTQSKGISANLNLSPVLITIQSESGVTTDLGSHDEQNDLLQNTSTSSMCPQKHHQQQQQQQQQQHSLNSLPELLISEWKDLDEEPLEDFEKLEQLCRISGDEEDILGNLELLESLKKTHEQKDDCAEDNHNEETKSDVPTQGHDMENAAESAACVNQEGRAKLPSREERSDTQSPASSLSSGHPPDVKDQGSLSKMPTKNGLMMQVRREHHRCFKVMRGCILCL
ncbi:Serine/threonine-protein kinase LMTK1 [Merluccius polli]|uniref:Serine/threonine-protein kinase LMTK1 n=1 Tax=Merluccius polli TaxID=89951 RepID=A0AA47MFI5_MERPO|nr:Serine/threonine-protein kinase LMTK1 [Merluccius polli]